MPTDRDLRQKLVQLWAILAFGREQATSLPQRGIRLLEEAIELFQAVDGDREQAHKLVDFVFSRPKGRPHQEIGGVSVTLLALAEAVGTSADLCEMTEITRVLGKPIEHFTARNQAKNDAGFLAGAKGG